MPGDVFMALDRLADEHPECERGRDFLARRASQFTGLVTTEDLLAVMKYSGGEIALRHTDTREDAVSYSRWTPGGLEFMWSDGVVETPPDSLHAFEFDVHASTVSLAPIPVEDTPFTEADRA